MMKRWLGVGAALLLAVGLGASVATGLDSKPASPAAPAPAADVPALEVGKTYKFVWARQALTAAVVEAPRGRWVKVKYRFPIEHSPPGWCNLDTVLYILQEPDDP